MSMLGEGLLYMAVYGFLKLLLSEHLQKGQSLKINFSFSSVTSTHCRPK